MIGKEIDDRYIAQVKAQVVNQAAIDEMQDQITIIYTPLTAPEIFPPEE